VLAGLAAGAALILFVAIKTRLREQAMMPLSLYRSRNFSTTNALTFLLYFALGGALYYLPFGLIRLGGYSATQAGAALLPFARIMGFGASLMGALGSRASLRLLPLGRFCSRASHTILQAQSPRKPTTS
jgi:hypothetical protein